MPGVLGRVDDSRGLAWRAALAARGVRPRLAGRFASGLARGARHERPVFVLGVPRSGTSTVKELLAASGELCAPPGESHFVWLALHHPRRSGWHSAAIGAGEVRRGERRFVNAFFHAHCGACRFVEKAPANSLRIPHIAELFPDAVFVVVRRDPCDVISSLINGWRHPGGRFRSFYVPDDLRIPDHPYRHQWRFALIPGWRDLIGRPIPEVAFAQWDAISRAIEDARPLVAPARWVDVHLEDLRARPDATLAALCGAAGIAADARVERRLEELLERPASALSPPAASKWRRDNPAEVGELLPRIAAASPARGYLVDESSGEFERVGPRRASPAGPST